MIVAVIIILSLAISSFGQDSQWVPGNNFDFAVALQYDVEPDVISSGVGGALTNAMGDISSITNQAFDQPPPVWTNYDTNGLPPEIFAQPVASRVSSNGTTSASVFGFSGIDDVLSGNFDDPDSNAELQMPIITGAGLSTSHTPSFSPITDPGADEGLEYFAIPMFDAYDGPYSALYNSFVTNFALFADKCRDSLHFRSWASQICAAMSLMHLFWASAVIGSGIFRSFVAGLTGISGGK